MLTLRLSTQVRTYRYIIRQHGRSRRLTLSRWVEGLGGWEAAYQKAQAFVSQLTLLEKVNLTTGTGWQGEACVGNTGSIPRLNFDSLCLQDSPLGVRFADYVSAFTAGGTVAASWDRGELYRRGYQMGQEHKAKGVDLQLGPVVGPLGRHPKGGVSPPCKK
ncbi:glycoside hydrolase family 3 protein [Dothidotthia symphoricarpi CBS 119687]|uniref:beta-glucosidase n=1 Tax=Dothidotthia symphoricarpi CBS 119687 TaxID=1392245 RepID=A0A6A6A3I8_9PLEO|nr:glycoside hydrolase family 3 protein [Dothidotthia symphoricarpi CBS 119687]KAF2125745.1 glycoside hydrolase family 3 protein [Dothidotthia symphoricarpi CBS 119687]